MGAEQCNGKVLGCTRVLERRTMACVNDQDGLCGGHSYWIMLHGQRVHT